MHVARLSLTDFRNYRSAELAFEPGATVIVGRNGQGKTNLVEAIGYLATLGSHRVSSDQALIRSGADAAIVRALLSAGGREVLLELQLNRQGANRAQVNRGTAKPRDLPRYAHTVLFAPEDLAIVRGEPSVRRRMLDGLLVQRVPRLAGVMADYDRVLKQRNSLLKSARARGIAASQLTTLDIWDERLVELGAELIDRREELVAELREPLAAAYRSIVDDDHRPELQSVLSIDGADPDAEPADAASAAPDGATDAEASVRAPTAERFAAALASMRRRELERGVTLAGPHRDDVLLLLNGLPAKGYASHGESWSFALALRLASAELLRRDSTTGDPVLVLDDVFAELDRMRRQRLAAAVGGYEQVLITAAVLEDVPEPLSDRVIRIAGGEVVESPSTGGQPSHDEPAPSARRMPSEASGV
ncbi:DNA replication and repair protein RecF [Agromyces luteolus]|uniref:DNA replication and repair protein RecF n=1 Tax=Agromyces luteolus TaxID=88373 RepID=A0A7C9HG02_9MICO|nr:DNA replication/repair protein RecF [Agromyces luteolus]MUN05887.1 DNA replication/repair protein RecF [Agromyces luteolus]GLK26440.1 DNA replication and repair protein RecF [Agromyces luteolus]